MICVVLLVNSRRQVRCRANANTSFREAAVTIKEKAVCKANPKRKCLIPRPSLLRRERAGWDTFLGAARSVQQTPKPNAGIQKQFPPFSRTRLHPPRRSFG